MQVIDGLAACLRACVDGRAYHVAQITDGVDRMRVEAVGALSGGAAHAFVHPGQIDGNVGVVDGTGVEERVHQRELVELTAIVRFGVVLEIVPDGAHAMHVIGDALCRLVEGHGEATLDMRAYLRTDAKVEPPARQPLHVPGGLRH